MFRLRLGSKSILIGLVFLLLIVTITMNQVKSKRRRKHYGPHRTTRSPENMDKFTKTICMQLDNTLRARHKTCFLRPDTGPCRADIIQWYFDVKQRKCYQFFWGGCQGNGNRFENQKDCADYCYLNSTMEPDKIPYFCSLSFDYGTCFGHYNRWGWDSFAKTCKRRIYSGCGGNQNNFETQAECLHTCLHPPNNTLRSRQQFTTCVPFYVAELQ